MLEYPTISNRIQLGVPGYAWDKIDGSNIRAEWSRKRHGFYKFGSKTILLDEHTPILGEAPDLIRAKFEKRLDSVFSKWKPDRAVAFFEFFGPSSFAGIHKAEQHDAVLLDVAPGRGLMRSGDFDLVFEGFDRPRLLRVGPIDEDFVEAVRSRTLKGMTFEGVVFKTSEPVTGEPVMFKIKSRAWLAKLKQHCGGDDMMFRRLA